MAGYLRKKKTERHGHKHNKAYDGLNKWVDGPAGINCPCCTRGNPSEIKVRSRRTLRRKMKITDSQGLD